MVKKIKSIPNNKYMTKSTGLGGIVYLGLYTFSFENYASCVSLSHLKSRTIKC